MSSRERVNPFIQLGAAPGVLQDEGEGEVLTAEAAAQEAVEDDAFDAPRTLLELPRRFVLTKQDFGLPEDVSLPSLADSALNGDAASSAAAAHALEVFLTAMDADVENRVLVNMKGVPKKDARGRVRTRQISRWAIEGMDGALGVRSGVPAPADYWQQVVRLGWLTKILPRLSFFSTVPDTDPSGRHTADLITRRMNEANPRRRKALAILAEAAKRMRPAKAGKASAATPPAPEASGELPQKPGEKSASKR